MCPKDCVRYTYPKVFLIVHQELRLDWASSIYLAANPSPTHEAHRKRMSADGGTPLGSPNVGRVWGVTQTESQAVPLGPSQLQSCRSQKPPGQWVPTAASSSVSSRGRPRGLPIPREPSWRDSTCPRSTALAWGCHQRSRMTSHPPPGLARFY